MRIAGAEVRQLGGPLAGSARNAQRRWTERRGLQLELHDDQGRVGLGEASPLPGYSTDSLDDAKQGLDAFAEVVSAQPVWHEDAPLLAAAEALGIVPGAGPAARFAIETAVLDLIGRRTSTPVHRLLGGEGAAVDLSVLLVEGDTPAAAYAAREEGYRGVKLKVGIDPEQELRELKAVREAVGDDVAIRIDANGMLDPSWASDWLGQVAELDVELVEEPVLFDVLMDVERPPVPVALDESLHTEDGDARLARALAEQRCDAVVLKPMALGGFARCMEVARVARDGGAKVVVSHMVDGPVALAAYAELALALECELAAGLAMHVGLSAFGERTIAAYLGARLEPHDAPGLGLGPPGPAAAEAGA